MASRASDGKITIKDVARAAGVAWSTASYALNNGPRPVSEDVRRRVLAAAREMGYSSNLVARGLVTGRSRTLGVLAPNLESYNATRQLAGVEAEAAEHDYRIVLATHLREAGRALHAQQDMTARRLDGIVSIPATADVDPSTLEGLPATGLPFALTYHAPVEGLVTDYAVVDQEQGGWLATRHLLAAGRNAVAFLGPRRRTAARLRLEGYRRAHAEAGVPVRDDLILDCDDFQAPYGLAALRRFLGEGARDAARAAPDAVFAASDALGAAALRAAHERGLRVPDDLAVVGFDDAEFLCEALFPALTSVRPPLYEIGRWAARRLLERLDRPDAWEPTTLYFPCSLTARESA